MVVCSEAGGNGLIHKSDPKIRAARINKQQAPVTPGAISNIIQIARSSMLQAPFPSTLNRYNPQSSRDTQL
jgi:hypothetical protein